MSIFEPLSGAVWSFPISKCTGHKVVEIMRIVMTIHGKVSVLRPDNGKSFIEGEFARWCKSKNIEIRPTSCYNPQANLAERHHRQINRMLDNSYSTASTVNDDIFEFCHAQNLLKKRSTGLAPFEILKGHIPPELVSDIYAGPHFSQPTIPATEILRKAWEDRNLSKLEKTLNLSKLICFP